MLFTAPFFIFFFFPLVFILQWSLPGILRNVVILTASLFFYYYGEKNLVWFLALSIVVNYIIAEILRKFDFRATRHIHPKSCLLWVGILFNIGLLGYFKYANFFVIEILSVDPAKWQNIALPIGISFYSFQCLSYLVDIYYGKTTPAKNLIDFGAYISCFPQLIAGPIVRFEEIRPDLHARKLSWDETYCGMQRFAIGLGKKMLIANPMGWVADQVWAMPVSSLDAPHAWLGMCCYTLQIYFDFSGYSDMAIGLGRMLGFHFPENFNYPYIASSIKDFWRRWHMTLTSWLRDYIYFPLGGSRAGKWQTMRNKLLIFVICGFWHGAAWTFLLWGLWHGFFIIVEGLWDKGRRFSFNPFLKHVLTLLIIMFGWAIFRSDTVEYALAVFRAAFFCANPEPWPYSITRLFRLDMILIILAGIICSMPLLPFLQKRWAQARHASLAFEIFRDGLALGCFIFGCAWAVGTQFNPFLYFRF